MKGDVINKFCLPASRYVVCGAGEEEDGAGKLG
jgi:hypothetical protein